MSAAKRKAKKKTAAPPARPPLDTHALEDAVRDLRLVSLAATGLATDLGAAGAGIRRSGAGRRAGRTRAGAGDGAVGPH